VLWERRGRPMAGILQWGRQVCTRTALPVLHARYLLCTARYLFCTGETYSGNALAWPMELASSFTGVSQTVWRRRSRAARRRVAINRRSESMVSMSRIRAGLIANILTVAAQDAVAATPFGPYRLVVLLGLGWLPRLRQEYASVCLPQLDVVAYLVPCRIAAFCHVSG
jgi:hypothetical protein